MVFIKKICGSVPVLRAIFLDTERVFTNQPHEFYASPDGLYGPVSSAKKGQRKSMQAKNTPKKAKGKGKINNSKIIQGSDAQDIELNPVEDAAGRELATKDQEAQEAQVAPEVSVAKIQTEGYEDISYNVHRICYPIRLYYRIGSGQTDSRNKLARGCLTRNVISSLPTLYGGKIEFDEL